MKQYIRGIMECSPIAALAAVCWLGWFNFKNNTEFLTASLINCLTLLVAIIISFILAQKKSNERKQKDIILDLLITIQHSINDPKSFTINCAEDVKALTMSKRDISNRIGILDKHKDEFNLKKEIEFINEKFNEYANFIGDHIQEVTYLSQSARELKRPLELIDQKIFEAMLKLFG